jgi:hypothetical protein
MYHDQGLIPSNTWVWSKGVNVTLGLPLVRTSPDHGTAFDIAGTGRADAASLEAVHGAATRLNSGVRRCDTPLFELEAVADLAQQARLRVQGAIEDPHE